jgi:hypothetical protein
MQKKSNYPVVFLDEMEYMDYAHGGHETPLFSISTAAKLLNIGMGRNELKALLREFGMILLDGHPSGAMKKGGYMELKTHFQDHQGIPIAQHPVCFFTLSGLNYLDKRIKQYYKKNKCDGIGTTPDSASNI